VPPRHLVLQWHWPPVSPARSPSRGSAEKRRRLLTRKIHRPCARRGRKGFSSGCYAKPVDFGRCGWHFLLLIKMTRVDADEGAAGAPSDSAPPRQKSFGPRSGSARAPIRPLELPRGQQLVLSTRGADRDRYGERSRQPGGDDEDSCRLPTNRDSFAEISSEWLVGRSGRKKCAPQALFPARARGKARTGRRASASSRRGWRPAVPPRSARSCPPRRQPRSRNRKTPVRGPGRRCRRSLVRARSLRVVAGCAALRCAALGSSGDRSSDHSQAPERPPARRSPSDLGLEVHMRRLWIKAIRAHLWPNASRRKSRPRPCTRSVRSIGHRPIYRPINAAQSRRGRGDLRPLP
jgi:hypothetical protein